jgi:tripartite-type tricarboxylate transporter receptor subunit TctC
MSRIVAGRLGEALGASVVFENRDGAGGLIGMEAARQAKPDGYTLICVSNGSMLIAPQLKKARPYDALINMASAGVGSQSHLAGVLLMTMANFESLHVPHKGGGPSVASIAGGQTHWTMVPAPAAMSRRAPPRRSSTRREIASTDRVIKAAQLQPE